MTPCTSGAMSGGRVSRVTGPGAGRPRKKRSQSVAAASAAAAPPSGVGASGSRKGTLRCTGPPPLPRLRATAWTIVWRRYRNRAASASGTASSWYQRG